MPVALEEDTSLKLRPRVLEACIRLQEMTLQMLPGEKLPTILELHAQLGMSVQTLHRAIQQLEARGVVQCFNGVGIFVAQAEKRVLTGNIGLIGVYPEMKYFGYLLRGVEKYTSQNDLRIMILGGCSDVHTRACEQVDGVLMCDINNHEERLESLPAHLPKVSMFMLEENVSNVVADEHGGAKLAVQHFLGLGHRKIACLMEREMPQPRRRHAGYCDALTKAGIRVDPRWSRLTRPVFTLEDVIVEVPMTYFEWGRINMQQWLREGWRELGCTAILVQNDTAAIGVMQVLQEEGIEVPQEVSVMGFDGTDLCDHVTPQLSSMKVPLAEIGYAATELLHQQIEHGAQDLRNIVLPLTLRDRKSTAAVSRA